MKQQRAFRSAYAAGVVDSDGTIVIRRIERSAIRKKYPGVSICYDLQVSVSGIDGRMLDALKGWFGGSIYVIDWQQRQDPLKKIVYRWEMTRKPALEFLKQIYPFLIYKKLQAEVAMNFQRHVSRYQQPMQHGRYAPTEIRELEFRETYYWKLRSLKRDIRQARAAVETKRGNSSSGGREAIVQAIAN